MDRYSAYVPIDRLHEFAGRLVLPDRCSGTALFADISGFTPLTEALVRKYGSQRGAEELTRYLNFVYDGLITCLNQFGGTVISFAGDAITCWFDQDEGVQAAACALCMQDEMKQFAGIMLDFTGADPLTGSPAVNQRFSLEIKIALATGPARRFMVGDPNLLRIDVLAGQTLKRLVAAEHVAERGEVILDTTTIESLGERAHLSAWRVDEKSGIRYGVMRSLDTIPAAKPFAQLPEGAVPEEQLKAWVLPPVYQRLSQGQGEFLDELRPAIAMFVNFSGIDYDGDPEAAEKLDRFVRWVQRVLAHYEAYSYQLIVGDKGSYLYGGFGAPIAHEDDAERAVSAALDVLAPPLDLDYIQEIKIGLSQGRLRVGAYGSPNRRTYSLLGDDVNLAARLMQAAGPGQVLANASIKQSAEAMFRWEQLPPMRLKGKAEPVAVFNALGTRPRQTLRLTAMAYALPMVGRQSELSACLNKLQLALQGQGQLVGMVGEAGMGKSRLLYEVIQKGVLDHTMAYFGGECQSHAIDSSYWVWQPVWRGLFGLDPAQSPASQVAALEARLNEIDPALLPRLPLLGTVFDLPIQENDLTQALDAKVRKTSLEALLVEGLQAAARQQPILIVLEDCQWMDALSHELLELVGRAIRELHVLVFVVYRPMELERLKTARISRLANFTEITLDEFSPSESHRLIELKLQQLVPNQGRVPELLIQRITAQAQGNPFYIEELLNYLHDRNIDPNDAGSLAGLELPSSLHSLILSRVDQLTNKQQITLKVASVIGRLFRAALLWGMYPELGQPEQVQADLDTLSLMELTAQDPAEQELTYFFKQIITQQVAYENLPYSTRAMLHNQLAVYIEGHYALNLGQVIDLLAFHFLRGENWPKALNFNLQAAERDQHEFANQAAISACQNAIQAAEHLPDAETLSERLMAHDMLGELYTLVGRYDQALEHIATARRLVEAQANSPETTRQQARFCRKTAEVYERRSEYETAFTWLERGLGLVSQEKPTNEAARIHNLGAGIYYRQGKYNDAIVWCQRSLTTAARLDSRAAQQTIALVNRLLGAVYNRLGDLENSIEYCRQSIAIFQTIGDYVGLAGAYNNLGISYSDQGDLDQSSQAYNRGLEINQKIGDIQQIGLFSNNLGNIALYRGEWEQAGSSFKQSIAIWKQIGNIMFEAVTQSNLAQVYIYQEQLELARHALEQSQRMFQESGAEGFLPELERRWSELYLHLEETEPALAHIRSSIALAEAQQDRLEGGKSYTTLGEIRLKTQELALARLALDESLQILTELNSEYEVARTRLNLARLDILQGSPTRARQQLALARPVLAKLGGKAELYKAAELEKEVK